MVNRKILISILLIFIFSFIHAQPSDIFFKPKSDKKIDTVRWKTTKEVGFYFNQVSFSNWNAGGTNSISASLSSNATANYKNDNLFWNSTFSAIYGINKQEGQSIRKTEDVLSVSSNFGYQKDSESNWFYSSKFSFNTQFANGFNYPNTDTPISRFMAPGYMFFGAGIEYGKHIERLSFYLSPITSKTTFVLDDDLANSGAFGVDPAIFDAEGNIVRKGKQVRGELGILMTSQYKQEILKNVKMNSLLRLYTDYLNSFGNIDLEWEVNFNCTVNRYIKASFGSHLRYDNDIKTEVERNEITNEEVVISGPKLQWKQVLGIGVVVDLDSLSRVKVDQ